jgi:hypothetical protein
MALKFAIGLHKLVAMIFAVSFEIIIQRAVDNESCHTMKNTLIITVLSNRSRKNKLHNNKKKSLFKLGKKYTYM